MLKRILLVLLVILIIIQFVHPARNVSTQPAPYNIATAYPIPANVKPILVKACLDCHSNNTRYRWYFKIQPLDWWLTNHIRSGKEELNFDDYTNKPIRYQFHKLQSAVDLVRDNKMPITSYKWTHKDAILADAEKKILMDWFEGIISQMKAKYPPDSLSRKRF
jgi:Haem-binding domain